MSSMLYLLGRPLEVTDEVLGEELRKKLDLIMTTDQLEQAMPGLLKACWEAIHSIEAQRKVAQRLVLDNNTVQAFWRQEGGKKVPIG